MFDFLRQSKPTDFSGLQLDLHSHLIPGIDDGVKTLEDSLHLVRELQEMGFSKIVTTPHVMSEFYPNTTQSIQKGQRLVQQAMIEVGLDISFEAAAEYFMDDYFETLLNKKDLLTLGAQYVLVEMSFFSKPPKLHDYIFQLQTSGFRPILAHPERYTYLDQSEYLRLRELGCNFQINTLSIIGHYGSAVRKIAMNLLKAGWGDYLGTDMHHVEHAEKLHIALQKNKTLQKVLHKYTFKNKELATLLV